MNIKQLVEELQNYDYDMQVMIKSGNYYYHIDEIISGMTKQLDDECAIIVEGEQE